MPLLVFICPYMCQSSPTCVHLPLHLFFLLLLKSLFSSLPPPHPKETKSPNTPAHPRYMHILTPPLSYFSLPSLPFFTFFLTFSQKLTFSSSLQTLTTLLLKSSSTDTPHSHLKQKITETITLPASSPHYSYYSSFL